MIQLDTSFPLSSGTLAVLQTNQNEISNAVPPLTFKQKVDKAKHDWDSRTNNAAFGEIKKVLELMCSGAKRCCYCEDSVGDEIEHIRPKSLYPDFCFVWDNYIYACGSCNTSKNNRFAIFRHPNNIMGELAKDAEPPSGNDVIINPRIENAMDFWELDLVDFIFRVTARPNSLDYLKARYTLDLLKLNGVEKDYLIESRKGAYERYKSHIARYVSDKKAEENTSLKIKNIIRKESHPTVWVEIKRQYQNGKLIKIDSKFCQYFAEAPEALHF